jgi:hypothetical protein
MEDPATSNTVRAANFTIATTNPLPPSSSNIASSSNSDEREQQKKDGDKKRKEAQRKLGQSFEEKDVVIEDGMITRIKDTPIQAISLEALKSFGRKLRMRVKSSINKGDLIKDLVNFIRLEEHRTSLKNGILGKSSGSSDGKTLPRLIYHDGTLFRVILTITDIDNRDSYLTTGHQIDRGQLGAKEHHDANYCNLARVYNDESNEQYSSCDVSISKYSDIYDSFNISDDTPSHYDKLDGRSFCQIVRFINAKYR